MDLNILSKRIKTHRTPGGTITRVSDDVLGEVLKAWEQWTGTAKDFARALDITNRQAVILVEKAKARIREGVDLKGESEFHEVPTPGSLPNSLIQGPPIEVVWDNKRVIRFSQVQQLVEFMKAVA